MDRPTTRQTLGVRFAQLAQTYPALPAVRWVGGQWTYSELGARADFISRELRLRGIEAGSRVAVHLGREPDSIAACLAIANLGAACVPLDPRYPQARVTLIVEESDVALVITRPTLLPTLGDLGRIAWVLAQGSASTEASALGTELAPASEPDAVVCIFFTSGSTGTPKGVQVTHDNVVHQIDGLTALELGPGTTYLRQASPCFDVSLREIFAPLLNGGTVAVYPDETPTPRGIKNAIAALQVNSASLTTALFNSIVDSDVQALSGLTQLTFGGEAASAAHVAKAQRALPDLRLFNSYGPTETTVTATLYRIPDGFNPEQPVPLGPPMPGYRLHIASPDGSAVREGEEGELWIGGRGVTRGYLDRPDLNAERFVAGPDGERFYRSGDRVCRSPTGELFFLGRADDQVKLRGYRIELGEVRHALEQRDGILTAAVMVREDQPGNRRLVAYLVTEDGRLDASQLRTELESILPDHMVPALFVRLDALPMTVGGKTDYDALPVPSRSRPELTTTYVAPNTALERTLCTVLQDFLDVDPVGLQDNFFHLGGNSLLITRIQHHLAESHGLQIDLIEFFREPTVAALVRYLTRGRGQPSSSQRRRRVERSDNRIAIVGMAGRYPGARDVDAFWENLRQGIDSITRFDAHEIDRTVPEPEREAPNYVRARGILDEVDLFDASFFGMSPLEARVTDPQQRVLFELAWHALEDAGYAPGTHQLCTGIYAGKFHPSYFLKNLYPHPDVLRRAGAMIVRIGNEKDYVATRVAHKLDLKGPAISVHTACSTSLVAVSMACESLWSGACDLALAGGVSITFPVQSGHLYEAGAMLSEDGRTRSFDAGATGTVFSDGAGVVVLKRYADAVSDGDLIHAVILGTATNNDGGQKASFTAPSIDGQASVIRAALEDAGVSARSIGYVEAHGTATPLGDPIEIAALTQAYRMDTQDSGFCAIGSVKSNVGHTVAAAGVAGLIKSALALRDQELPPTLHWEAPNPKIDFEATPFVVNSRAKPWPRGEEPRRAAVSSFGVGGTNAHVVIEEAPSVQPSGPSRPLQLLTLSARNESSLDTMRERLAACFEDPGVNVADAAFTLAVGRADFPVREFAIAEDASGAARALQGANVKRAALPDREIEPIFLFPGQGAQYLNMGHYLYETESVYRDVIDRVTDRLMHDCGFNVRSLLFGDDSSVLNETRFTQPAIFATECALAALWRSWGIEPTAMLGHSVGEFACAVLADVWSLEDAASLVARRGELMQQLPGGSMAAVKAGARQIREILGDRGLDVVVAAKNSPRLATIAGPEAAVDEACRLLEERSVVSSKLRTSHAFHSPMMEAAIEPFAATVREFPPSAPTRPFVSSVTGTWITPEDACDPHHWARQVRDPVEFESALSAFAVHSGTFFLEVGPRRSLATFARHVHGSIPAARNRATLASGDSDSELKDVLEALGYCWMAGARVEWKSFYANETRRRVRLPTYAFDRKSYWIEPPEARPGAEHSAAHAISNTVAATAETQEPTPSSPVDVANDAVMTPPPTRPSASRHAQILKELFDVLEDVTGLEFDGAQPNESFLELGLDSLSLTQLANHFKGEKGIDVSFRDLMERYVSPMALAQHLLEVLPPEAQPAPVAAAPLPPPVAPAHVPTPTQAVSAAAGTPASTSEGVARLIEQQLQIMAAQVELLRGSAVNVPVLAPAIAPTAEDAPAAAPATLRDDPSTEAAPSDESAGSADAKPVIAKTPIRSRDADLLSESEKAKLDALTERYVAKTRKSKEFAERHRKKLADPRTVMGFRPATKELTYPIVVERSKGPRLWDLDGNEYVDVLNGFGMNYFGWQPDFVNDAIKAQLDRSIEIGPQSPLAGEVAELFTEMTGLERVAFTSTGTEAVCGAMRLARTVTGRSRIAVFAGSYHGTHDEALVRGTKRLKTIPAAPGVPRSACENMLVLDYGTDESLEILEREAANLAAVMVEPVQSRRPDLQPKEFLHAVRDITSRHGAALIFDEVITGFRTAPGGAQEFYGIRADIATYGKVVGGGVPVAMIAGSARFLDALDGGQWQYGDDSKPEVGVTYHAGTFVRHPLALAASRAVLLHLKEQGPALQQWMNERTTRFVEDLNQKLVALGAPMEIRHFASLWRPAMLGEYPLSDLFAVMVRMRGVHMLDSRPCFWTTSHRDEDIVFVSDVFVESAEEMLDAGFWPRIEREPAVVTLPPGAPTVDEWIETTDSQRELLGAIALGGDASKAYNESITLTLEGAVDLEVLRHSIQDLVDCHEALRTVFAADGTGFRILPELTLEIPTLDLRAEGASALQSIIAAEAETEFDLVKGPLFNAKIVQVESESVAVVMTAHHLVCDGWSFGVLLSTLAERYRSRKSGSMQTAEPKGSFRRFISEEREWSTTPEFAQTRDYWLEVFGTPVPPLELPTDRPRPPIKTFRSGREDARLDRELVTALRKAAGKRGVSLFAALLTGFNALLQRLSQQSDFVVGIPTAGQALSKEKDLVGHCVNVLPLRLRFSGDTSAEALLQMTGTALLDAMDRQHYTLGNLLREKPMKRDASRLPLASVLFNLDQPRSPSHYSFGDVRAHYRGNPRVHEIFELFLNAVLDDGEVRLELQYNSDLFDRETIAAWLRAYEAIISSMVDSLDTPIAELQLLGDTDSALLDEWNATAADFDLDRTVHACISSTAETYPEAIALRDELRSLTYRELDELSNRLAHYLLQDGLSPGEFVGVSMERSVYMVVSCIAIWKAGGAYLPLDPSFPTARLRFMCEDCDVKRVLTRLNALGFEVERSLDLTTIENRLGEQPANAPAVSVSPQALAYAIYTSGSTGTPKGVQVTHRSVVNLLESMKSTPGLASTDVLLAVTTLSFDISVVEIFLPLVVGAQVVVASSADSKDGAALVSLARRERITVMQGTPTTWRFLIAAGWNGAPKLRAWSGGEPLPRDLAETLTELASEAWNVYGPTETTVWVTCRKLERSRPVDIGRPFSNTELYVLDRTMARVPMGVPGELYIGGECVAEGYRNRPELNAERFLPDPFRGGTARLYRTGDLARFKADGAIEFLGRVDRQIKLRGYRVELREIESVVGDSPNVKEVAAKVWEDSPGDQRLAVYYVLNGPEREEDIRQRLTDRLPGYMHPQFLVQLDALPTTPNLKVSYEALPKPHRAEGPAKPSFEEPATDCEHALAAIWSEVLRVDQVGRDDNFFEIGGHSLLALQVAMAIKDRMGFDVSMGSLVMDSLSTIATSVEAEQSSRLEPDSAPPVAPSSEGSIAETARNLFGKIGRILR